MESAVAQRGASFGGEKLYSGRQGEAVKILLEHGADPRIREERGKTALGLAIAAGHEAIAALLQNKAYESAAKTDEE